MTEDELAVCFERHRRPTIRIVNNLFPQLDPETLDMLYTDCWFLVREASFKIPYFQAFIKTVLANQVKNFLRDCARSSDLFSRGVRVIPGGGADEEEEGHTAWLENIPDPRLVDAVQREETLICVRAAMEQLPKTLAIVGEWHYVDGMTFEEIGTILGCTRQNVHLMMVRFRLHLRREYIKLANLGGVLCPIP